MNIHYIRSGDYFIPDLALFSVRYCPNRIVSRNRLKINLFYAERMRFLKTLNLRTMIKARTGAYKCPCFTNNSIVIRHLRGENIYESNWHCPPCGRPH